MLGCRAKLVSRLIAADEKMKLDDGDTRATKIVSHLLKSVTKEAYHFDKKEAAKRKEKVKANMKDEEDNYIDDLNGKIMVKIMKKFGLAVSMTESPESSIKTVTMVNTLSCFRWKPAPKDISEDSRYIAESS